MNLVSKNPTIYLIGGKARSGKTTFGNFMKEEFMKNGKKVASLMYAEYIKNYAKDHFGWDGTEENKPRELLQKLGTDIIRKGLNKPNFLINRLCEDIEILSYFFDIIIVDDVREKDEIVIPKLLFQKVISIKITRENRDDLMTEEQRQHPTEVLLDNYNKFNIVVENDGSLDELKYKSEKIAISNYKK